MPVFNLGPLGRFEIRQYKGAEEEPTSPTPTRKPSSLDQREPQLPPPPYTDVVDLPETVLAVSSIPDNSVKGLTEFYFHSPSQAAKRTCKIQQFRRYLIEIIALTFGANFDELNTALYETETIKNTNTILSEAERIDLLDISHLVRKVHGQLQRNEIHAISRADEQKLRDTVVNQGEKIDLQLGGCALDLIGWYGLHVYPLVWSQTIPAYWATNAWASHSDFIRSMRVFKNLLHYVPRNRAVERVLEQALEDCRRRCGLENLTRTILYHPRRDGYYEMGRMLCGDSQLDILSCDGKKRVPRGRQGEICGCPEEKS